MSDLDALGLLLVVLYLSECLVIVRRGGVVFRLPLYWGAASATPPSKAMGDHNVGVALLNPLPPFGRVYVTAPWPFVCDAVWVVAAQTTSLWMDPLPRQSGRRLAFDAIQSVSTIDKNVFVNGDDFVRCTSPVHARAAAGVLKTLSTTPPAERSAVLEQLVRDSFNVGVVRARLDAHRRRGLPLLVATMGAFAALFVVTPGMVTHEGLQRWCLWLALIYGWVAVSAMMAFSTHRSLQPAARGERWLQLLLSLVAPTVAVRGNDKVGRFLLADMHPVVAAVALLRGDRRQAVVGAMLRDLRQPRLPTIPDGASDAIDKAFRAQVTMVATEVAADAGVNVEAAFTAPDGTPLYCRRCQTGYTRGTVCGDCGGVPLTSREVATAETPNPPSSPS